MRGLSCVHFLWLENLFLVYFRQQSWLAFCLNAVLGIKKAHRTLEGEELEKRVCVCGHVMHIDVISLFERN